MAESVYPAVFSPNKDGSYTITFPDLPGCISEGKSLGSALDMAESALTQWLDYLEENEESLPAPSAPQTISVEGTAIVNLVCVRRKEDRAVRRTVSIPKWMDDRVAANGLSLSRVLQDALRDRLAQ